MIGGRGKLHMCRTTLFGCYISKFPEQFKPNRAEPRFRGRCSVSARGGGCSVSVRSRGECSCSVSVLVSAEHKNCVRSRFTRRPGYGYKVVQVRQDIHTRDRE